jgi:hypothetical protein
VEPVEGASSTEKKKVGNRLTKGAKIALAALHEAIEDCGQIPPASNHIRARVKCVTQDQWRDYSERRGISNGDSKDAVRKAFGRKVDLEACPKYRPLARLGEKVRLASPIFQ